MACTLPPADHRALEDWARELQDSPNGGERAALLRRTLAALVCAARDSSQGLARVAWTPEPQGLEEGKAAAEAPPPQEEARPSGMMTFCPAPEYLTIKEANILETGFGRHLKEKRLMRYFVLGFGMLLVAFISYDPFASLVPEEGELIVPNGRGEGTVGLRIGRTGRPTRVIKQLCSLVLWYLMMHNMNKELFIKAFRTFDALIIMGSFLITSIVWFYNMFTCWGDYYDTEWFLADIADTVLTALPSGIIIATMDCWRVSTWVGGERLRLVKIFWAFLAAAVFAQGYVSCTLVYETTRWSQVPACIGTFCTSPREIFASAELQKVIFLGKLVMKYGMGWPFAFIRPRYNHKDAGPACGLVSEIRRILLRCFSKRPVSAAG